MQLVVLDWFLPPTDTTAGDYLSTVSFVEQCAAGPRTNSQAALLFIVIGGLEASEYGKGDLASQVQESFHRRLVCLLPIRLPALSGHGHACHVSCSLVSFGVNLDNLSGLIGKLHNAPA